MTDVRAHLAMTFRLQRAGCAHGGAPFYADLCDLLAGDAESGGPTIAAMGEYASAPFGNAYHLRLLGGLHRMALANEAPGLRAHYPSTGGDGDARAVWPVVEALLRDPPPALRGALERPLQTNEVGRSASLAAGMAWVARVTGLPLRVLEIGSSAGLNLRLDRYFYAAGGRTWGDPSSTVRFVESWDDGVPPFGDHTVVRERRGCDLAPIDVAQPGADLTLLSFVWPGQDERFERLRAALDIARVIPVEIDAAPADAWLPDQLAAKRDGVATVVFHSIVWQYLPAASRANVLRALAHAGASASPNAPLAYLRLEPVEGMSHTELRCTVWSGGGPGGEEHLLANAGFHAGRVTWLAGG